MSQQFLQLSKVPARGVKSGHSQLTAEVCASIIDRWSHECKAWQTKNGGKLGLKKVNRNVQWQVLFTSVYYHLFLLLLFATTKKQINTDKNDNKSMSIASIKVPDSVTFYFRAANAIKCKKWKKLKSFKVWVKILPVVVVVVVVEKSQRWWPAWRVLGQFVQWQKEQSNRKREEWWADFLHFKTK